MNKFYRVILSIATFCLVIGIVVCIIVAATGGWTYFRHGFHYNWDWNWHNSSNYETENINMTFDDDIKSLDFTINYGDVTIKEGTKFSLVAKNVPKDSFETKEVSDGILKIKQHADEHTFHSSFWGWGDSDGTPKIEITVPKGFIAKEFNLDAGVGQFEIDSLKTEYTYLKVGAGELKTTDFSADKIKIDGGVGSIRMENTNLKNIDMNSGVGEVRIQGTITGENKITSGVGEVRLDLDGDKDDYYVNVDSDIGDVSFNNEDISGSIGDRSAKNSIDVDASVGETVININ